MLVEKTCKKLQKGKTADRIADELEEDESFIREICKEAEKYAPDYDYGEITQMIVNKRQEVTAVQD